MATTGKSLWRGLGNTDAASFGRAVGRTWDGKGVSPMAGEADAVWDVVSRANLGRLAVAMLWHERKNDSWKRDYGLDATFRNPFAMKAKRDGSGGWARYGSYRDAAEDWCQRLLDPGGPYAGAATLADLIHVYAPSSDGNDEKAYVTTVGAEIDALPLVAGGGAVATLTYGKVARPAASERIVPDALNRAWDVLGQRSVKGVCLHRMLGTLWGTDAYFRAGAQALTDYGVDNTTGELLRWNNEFGAASAGASPNRTPWASGPWNNVPGDGAAFVAKFGANGINQHLVSLEISGQYSDPLSEAAKGRIAQLIAWEADQAKVPHDKWPINPATGLTFLYWHNEFVGTAYKPCPGSVVMDWTPALIEQVRGLLRAGQTGEPSQDSKPVRVFTLAPDWLDDEMVRELFPEADQRYARTQAWLARAAASGEAPRFVRFWGKGTAGELIEFADGRFLDAAGRWK